MNPLLEFDGLPQFASVKPEHIAPALDALLAAADTALAQVAADDFPADLALLGKTLDVPGERLVRAWGIVGHLNAVADTPELRAAYNAALPRVTDFFTRLGSNDKLYALYKRIDPAGLSAEQQRVRELALQRFELGGAALVGDAKARFAQIEERLAELGQKFGENALDATDKWSLYVETAALDGCPADLIESTRATAQAEGKEGHKLTLKLPLFVPLLQFGKNRALRERMYRAYATRASDQAEGEFTQYDNAAIMRETLALREEKAGLLGFANFAEYSLAAKMAETPLQVTDFLRDLGRRSKTSALADRAAMEREAQSIGIADANSWDWPFLGERVKEAQYAFSEQEVKQYFTEPRVVQGLFQIVETLFDVAIREDSAPVWHPSVKFYRMERNGQLLAQFYLDNTARDGKRGGAWMDICRERWMRPDTGKLQTPVAYLNCNFAAGAGGKPALLSHRDVVTLFHEFGHGLHLMLTQVNEYGIGMSSVEWDAIELPSQFMENFCWEWDVVRHMTAHVDTGEPMPQALFDKMRAAKNFQSGMQTLRQLEFGLYDMGLHIDAAKRHDMLAHERAVRAEVSVVPPPEYFRGANTFSHLFGGGGGYAAGYYSYKWAELLSADAYAAFEESRLSDGRFDPQTGSSYRREILEAGAKRPAMDSYRAFRGREPSLEPLLRHHGLA
jgi:oligopeptidase A